MSRILNRPMFRGGGKVSSYGNGITTGLADGGMPLLVGQHPNSAKGPDGREMHEKVLTVNKDYLTKDFFNKDYKSRDYTEKREEFKAYEPEFKTQQDYLNAYSKELDQKEFDIMAGMDDYSGYKGNQERYDYLAKEDGQDEFIDRKRMAQNKIIDEASNYGLDKQTDLEKLIISQTKNDTPAVRTEAEIEADLLKKLKGKELTKEEELAALEKEQAFFEKMLGGGKSAMIEDASNMAINYAAGAFKEGATVKSSFADFFEKESKRPSRRMKVKDAATQAAIQSYLTGKTSYQKFQNDIDSYGTKLAMKDKFEKKDLTIDNVLRAEAGNNGKVTNEGVMARSFDRIYEDVPGYAKFQGELKPDTDLVEGGIYYSIEGNDRIIYIVSNGETKEIKRIFN